MATQPLPGRSHLSCLKQSHSHEQYLYIYDRSLASFLCMLRLLYANNIRHQCAVSQNFRHLAAAAAAAFESALPLSYIDNFSAQKKTRTFTQHCDEAPFMNGEKRTRHTSIYNRIRKAKWAHVIRFRVLSAFGTRLELLEYIYICGARQNTHSTQGERLTYKR